MHGLLGAELPLANALAAPGPVAALWLTEPGRSSGNASAGKCIVTGSDIDGQVTAHDTCTAGRQMSRPHIYAHDHPPYERWQSLNKLRDGEMAS